MSLTHVKVEPAHLEEMKEFIHGYNKSEKVKDYLSLFDSVIKQGDDFYITSINITLPLKNVKEGMTRKFLSSWTKRYGAYHSELMRVQEREQNKQFGVTPMPKPRFYFIQNTDVQKDEFTLRGFFILNKVPTSPFYRGVSVVMHDAIKQGLRYFIKLNPSVVNIHYFTGCPSDIDEYIKISLNLIDYIKDDDDKVHNEQIIFNSSLNGARSSKPCRENAEPNFVNARGELVVWNDNMSSADNRVGYFI